MILKINLKTVFSNHGLKVNLKSYLSITILRLIFKTVIDKYDLKKYIFFV